MKLSLITNNADQNTRIEIDKRIAFHQAGHAAAICLGNQQKQLPAVHFQVIIKPQESDEPQSGQSMRIQGKYTAKLEGGRLIQSLPLSFAEAAKGFSSEQQKEYLCAIEADVINLLAGSLAEAKYVASRDGEVFNPNLVNLDALHFYGGSSDLKFINEYMECFKLHKEKRAQKLTELFLAAFNFVNNRSNWYAISVLAEYILDKPKDTIHCEELISLLKSRFY